MNKHFFKLALIALTVLALAACSNGKGTEAANPAGNGDKGGDETYSFAFLTNTQNNTFQTAMNETYERLAKEKGYKYTMLDPDYDLNKQINQMSDAANQGFDAVFVIPVDSAGIRQGLEAMSDRNIPVFNVDTAVIKEDRDLVKSIVATDAFMAGKLMGQQMVNDYPDGAKIAILDFPSNESCVQRVKGFMEGLGSQVSKFEIVAQQDGKAALDASMPIAEDIIQANADIDAFFAINDPSALGVAAAIKASGRTDIGVYSIDASPDGKEALLDGSFTAVSAQVPIQIAETSFSMAVDHLEGEAVSKEVLLPSHIVTKEMAKETAGKWQ
ncbi:sugar ABC transporter substrate-binding protein [Paenibacillus macerans]|uniref:sugar ABC transporter substrate-binding protein n=1 Tax=Paenibacillus macerans TaxID=44252 RepID=UPI003D3130C0